MSQDGLHSALRRCEADGLTEPVRPERHRRLPEQVDTVATPRRHHRDDAR